MITFKGSHFEKEIVLWGLRWSVAYRISDRQLEEMMRERGVDVDHATLNRWVVKHGPGVGEGIPSAHAAGGPELAHGGDRRARESAVDLFVSCGGQGRPTVDFLLKPT